jgi:hypothetical protein
MGITFRRAAVAMAVILSIASISTAGHVHGGVHMGGGAHFHGGFAHYGHGGFHYGYPHYHYGFGYTHYHYGPHWGFYGYYAPYYYPSFSLSFGPAYYYAPAYYYSSPVVATYTAAPATVVTQARTAERIPAPRQELPVPAESRSFRYDGDRPAAPPVERIPPARELDAPKVPELPSPPAVPRLGPSPSDMAVATPALSVTKKYTYQAYGEDRLAKPSPREAKTVVIRRDK